MFDVITIGSATVDVFAHTNFSETVNIIEPGHETNLLAYPVGSKILINELRFNTGGGGTNTAVALARLGHKVAWIGKLGSDDNAEFILRELEREKVDALAAKGSGLTGYSIILDSIEHDRTILTFKGENDNLDVKELPLKKLKSKWFYFSSMMDKSFATVEKLSQFAKKNEIKIAFNASEYLAKKGYNYLKNILKNTEIFVLNKEEAEMLTQGTDIYKMLVELRKMGPKICVITDGKNGSYTYDGSHLYTAKPPNVKVVETTGAGDAFASTFLSALLKKKDICFALRMASANAASVITHPGAKNKLLTFSQILKSLKLLHSEIAVRKLK